MVIQTDALSFNFGNQQVVKALSLEVPEGSIYGFLGPNGAGKTTTIKLLLNLLKTQEGSIRIFGLDLQTHRTEILSQIGSLIEQPALYAHMSGRENLLNRALLLQLPRTRVEEMLHLVQLVEAADKKAGKYSLGMKQRLGIALALLPNPRLLILDEPTNGLDPNGIIEIRELMIKLVSDHQKTVFVSSHMLSEVEKMATHVGIINHGELLFQGDSKKLESISQPMIQIEAAEPEQTAKYLSHVGIDVADVKKEHILVPYISQEEMAAVNKKLIEAGFTIYSIHKIHKDLEKLFLAITQKA